MNKKTVEWSGKRSTYFTKEGVKASLQKLIIYNIPNAVVESLHDEDHGFAKVSPLGLQTHIFTLAKQVDTIGIETLLKE